MPTDFSAGARLALQYAVQLAQELDARLSVMHSWPVPVTTWEAGWALTPELYAMAEAATRSQLDDMVDAIRDDVDRVEGRLVHGQPSDAIIRTATMLNADLIVMGTHGRRGLTRVLLGSVAEAVVRQAPCAVLTIKAARTSVDVEPRPESRRLRG